MTLVEFHKKLFKIDFEQGLNIESLEQYLLACLAQLNLHKDRVPSYELFLMMYDESRNGACVDFDPAWKEIDLQDEKWESATIHEEMDWEMTINHFRSLIADLIHTKELRSQANYPKRMDTYEWTTENGFRFYNGTTPGAILQYTATRLEGEYHPSAFQEPETEITWMEFWEFLEFGIQYE